MFIRDSRNNGTPLPSPEKIILLPSIVRFATTSTSEVGGISVDTGFERMETSPELARRGILILIDGFDVERVQGGRSIDAVISTQFIAVA